MSTQPRTNTPPNGAAIQKAPETPAIRLQEFLNLRRPHLEAALPKSKGLTVERLIKLAMMATTKQPQLQDCDLSSVFQALMQCAELGLEPSGTLGHAYLVPFKDKKTGKTLCQLIIGYRGLIDLARRSGALKQIEAHAVHERDVFRLRFGLEPLLEHEPCLSGNPGALKLVYCIAQLADGAKHVEVMTLDEVKAIRSRSRAGFSPWDTDFEEMAKKTVARRTCKWIPMSSELARALDLEEQDEGADQHGGAGLTVVAEVKPQTQTAKTKDAVRAQLAAKTGPIIDVRPNETEEQAVARVHAENEPPPPSDADAPPEVG